jgi:hypothetical protein
MKELAIVIFTFLTFTFGALAEAYTESDAG